MFRSIRDVSLWFLIEDSKQKKIILYSEPKYNTRVKALLKNLDIELAYCIGDNPYEDVASVYDLLMEDPQNIMVVVAKDDFASAEKELKSLGLVRGVNYKNLKHYTFETLGKPYYYDPVCGYNLYTGEGAYNGFKVFGNPNDTDAVRIVTMGGSTSDAYLYAFKSWSEILHEILNENGIKNTVLCGAVSGYSSADELFKIIRDGIALSPDIVINYSGCNDVKLVKDHYINAYMKRISGFLEAQNNRLGSRFESNPFGITWGVKSEENEDSNYAVWFRNQKMIHSVCDGLGIKQLTFHQPNLCNGKSKLSEYERNYLANICFCGADRQSVAVNIDQAVKFRKMAQKDSEKEKWLIDFADIFDDFDVYVDRLHVNEQGNRIIASNIFEVLKQQQFL